MKNAEARQQLLQLLQAALEAVNGRVRVREYLRARPLITPVRLIALGKAACAMARGAHDVLGAGILAALVVTKAGHAEPLPWPVTEAGHPLPDARSLAAGNELMRFVEALPPDARVLVLLSGGASALIECLPPGVDLPLLQRVNDWLLASGLDIVQMNRLRKQISLIKGGRLAQRLAPREVLCLAISDVPGDDPRSIGSGPLVADESAASISATTLPEFVRTALAAAAPPPRADDVCFARVRFDVVARLDDAKRAAATAALGVGWRPRIDGELITGDAADAGARLAQELLRTEENGVRIWGGETTVQLPPNPGRGGRNQSVALSAAIQLAGRDGVYLLAAGTDGSDGPTQDAGALVDADTVARGEAQGLDARAALSRADAGSFLEASGDLINTGPTGTNVMDLMLGVRMK